MLYKLACLLTYTNFILKCQSVRPHVLQAHLVISGGKPDQGYSQHPKLFFFYHRISQPLQADFPKTFRLAILKHNDQCRLSSIILNSLLIFMPYKKEFTHEMSPEQPKQTYLTDTHVNSLMSKDVR